MNLIRPIVSLFLASLVLIASIGVTVNLHLCAGEVQSFALFVKAQPCKETQKTCHGVEHHSKRNGCCEEESIVVKGKETNAEVKITTQLTPSFDLINAIAPVLYAIIEVDSFTPKYTLYKPPLIEHDITLFVQSFLI